MSEVGLNLVLDRRFRSNPAYELVPFHRLPLDQQELLKDLTADPAFYGVLLPRVADGRAVKAVCRETALLLHTMLQPGSLPHYMQQSYVQQTQGKLSNQAVAEMVLDGVLEMEHEGRFVSGVEAHPLIYAHSPPAPDGVLPHLSQAALEYAQALGINDVGRLSARLYFYNRIPMTPQWTRRFPSERAIVEFLGIDDPANQRRLDERWQKLNSTGQYGGWFKWRSHEAGSVSPNDKRLGYKLYVSPLPAALPAVFRAVVKVLDNSVAHHFKVGCDAGGLLRPDKFVIYFQDFEPLQRASREIAAQLSGCAAHGVPFTAAISDDGLLSWGIDPPQEKGALSWQEPESWRLWVTNRLATALISARNHRQGTMQPWQFALERLRLENIDTATWTPTQRNVQTA